MPVHPVVSRLPNLALPRRFRVLGALLGFALTMLGPLPAMCADDGMFPAAPPAQAAIDFDGNGFLIHGKRTFIASAGMEYARVPRALWRDRLLRLKRAGFNCVEMYTFWNWHEPQEGKFDFTGDHDLDAFLKLVKSHGDVRHLPRRAVLLRRVGQRRLPALAALQAGRAASARTTRSSSRTWTGSSTS